MPKKIRAGAAQAAQSAHLGRNLREIARFVVDAAREKLDLLVFPECALTGYGPAFHPSPTRFDPDAVEAGLRELRELARASGVSLLVGAHLPHGRAWTNSLLCVRADGRLGGRYDKAHLYGRDPEYYESGGKRGAIVSIRRMRIGLQICFDVRFPEPFRDLALRGAHLIAVPSYIHGRNDMWKGPVIEGHVRSRAAENGRFLLFANAAGRDQNAPSMIADPRGELLARARRGAKELIVAELDLSRVSDDYLSLRRTDLYPEAKGKRP